MRIERLDLSAFGPFTDLSLDLAGPGVHLVYGPNEAGKTSALAALRSLLYGIPHRTPFGFLHGMPHLKLGAVLGDGSDTLEVVRHKRNRNPLTAPDGSPVSEGELLGFLNGVPQEVFTTVFALTLTELQQGGKNLIRGEGDIGQALYSASSGQDTAAVLKSLEERQRSLYLRTGSVPRLNTALNEYKEVVSKRTLASTVSEELVRLQNAVRDAEKSFGELDDRLGEAEAGFHYWDSLKSALPSLRIRRQALTRLEEIRALGPLAGPDDEERLNGLEKALELSKQQRKRAEGTLEAYRDELSDLHVDEELSKAREDVGSLVRSVETITEADLSLTEHTDRAREHRAQAGELLRRVRPDAGLGDVGVPRVAAPAAEHLVELARKDPGLRTRVGEAREQVRHGERALDRARADLAALPENGNEDALGNVVAEFPSALVADLDRAYKEEAKTAARFDALVAEPGWGAEAAVEDLLSAAVPTKEVVADHRDRLTRLTAELKSSRKARTKAERELKRSRGELESLRAQEDPPTVEELRHARQERDALWQRIRKGDADGGLALDFQSALVKSDQLADRLRDSAEAVAERLTLESGFRKLEQDLSDREEDLGALTSRRTELDREWDALWPAAEVPAPALDMAGTVLDRVHELRELHRERGERKRALAVSEESALALTSQLVDLLTTAGVAADPLDVRPRTGAAALVVLPQLKALAEDELNRRRQAAQQRATVEALVQAAEEDLEKALDKQEQVREEKAAWSLEWDRAATAEGFAAGSDPEEVRSGLVLLEDAATAWDQARTADVEAERARQKITEFDRRLAAAFERCGRPLPRERTEHILALEELHRDAEENAATSDKLGNLERAVASEESELFQARDAWDAAQEKLAILLAETEVPTTAELREAIGRSREAEKERNRLHQAEEQLAGHGETDDLEERVRHLTDAEISGHFEQAKRGREEVKRLRDEAHAPLADARSALARVDGTAEAARLAEEEAALADRIADQAEEYMKVTLARRMLLDRMEEYRKRHQDPVLRRAEELFSLLTLGEFPRLHPDLDENGGNVLRVVRRNGQIVKITELSEGTADQLYLALRLASLEHYADAKQTMPFVVDDVFMTFDDERGEAALRVLDGLSDRFQVVVFTHHAHLADLAVRALPSGRAHVHELPRYTPPVRSGADGAPSDETPGRRDLAGSGERTCKSCQEPFTHTGRGRPPLRCPDCRG